MFFIKKFDELVIKDELVVTDIDFVLRKNICQEHQLKNGIFYIRNCTTNKDLTSLCASHFNDKGIIKPLKMMLTFRHWQLHPYALTHY